MYWELKKKSKLKKAMKMKRAIMVDPFLIKEIEEWVDKTFEELKDTVEDWEALKVRRNKFILRTHLDGYDDPQCCKNCMHEPYCDWEKIKSFADKQHFTKSGIPLPPQGLFFPPKDAPKGTEAICTFFAEKENKIGGENANNP